MAAPSRTSAPDEALPGVRILAVEGRFYDHINDELVAGAREAVEAVGGTLDVVTVPGALEIPAAIGIVMDGAAAAGQPYDGAVALGCVIRGETFHFDIVAGESSRALMDMTVARKLALGNGILTVENEEQAVARAYRTRMNKGADAARAALALVRLKRRFEPGMADRSDPSRIFGVDLPLVPKDVA